MCKIEENHSLMKIYDNGNNLKEPIEHFEDCFSKTNNILFTKESNTKMTMNEYRK